MDRPRRRLGRRTWRVRKVWHRAVRPARRPLGVVVFWGLLGIACAGLVGTVASTYSHTSFLRAGEVDHVLDLEVDSDAYASGLRTGDRVLSVKGDPVSDSTLTSGRRFSVRGESGKSAPVVVVRGQDTLSVNLVVDALDVRSARAVGLSAAAVDRVQRGLWFLALAALIVVGAALYYRARGRGYLADASRTLLAVAGGFGGLEAVDWLDGVVPDVAETVARITVLILVMIALPALAKTLVRFPDGRHVPRWTRHVRSAIVGSIVVALGIAFAAGIVSSHDGGESEVAQMIAAGVLITALVGGALAPMVGLVGKYKRTPDLVVRQQMKWVLLPFGAFFGVVLLDVVLGLLSSWLDASHSVAWYLADVVASILGPASATAIPIGILGGALNFRPWDADQWIARSVAVGAATLGLAAVFAGGAEALRIGLRSSMGDGAESVAAALAAVVALAVFNPMREWLTRRADADLIRTKERLTDRLPLLLAGRQVVASPQEVGRVAIAAVRDALETDRAAVLDLDPDGWEVVACDGLEAEATLRWADAALDPASMPECSVQVWEDPAFVLRVPLRSAEDELVGVLALGTHGKGRGYSTEERKALDAASRSLAEALRVAERREEAQARQYARLAALVDRLGPAGDGSAPLDLEVG